jgi:hypothetical protein
MPWPEHCRLADKDKLLTGKAKQKSMPSPVLYKPPACGLL